MRAAKRCACAEPLRAVHLAGEIAQAVHVGDRHRRVPREIVEADRVGVARPRVVAIAVRREGLVDEALRLADDRERRMDERREPPLRGHALRTVPEDALGRRTEGRDMARQGGGDLAEEVRPLRQNVVAVAIGQPVFGRSRRMDDLLQAEDIGRGRREVGDQRRVQRPAPAVQAHDAHRPAAPSRLAPRVGATKPPPIKPRPDGWPGRPRDSLSFVRMGWSR